MREERGFTLIEMLVTTGITVVLLAATMSSFNDALGINEKATLIADLEQNLRAGAKLLVQDCINAGWGIPTGGIPIPGGAGATPVVRPGPPGTNFTFAPAASVAAVNPGATLGPRSDGRLTDIVNILYADNLLPLNERTLNAVVQNGAQVVVHGQTRIHGVNNEIREGDLIALSNALGSTLQYVTATNGQTISFDPGDPMHLNQPNASQGSITQLKNGNTFPPTTATRVWLITYYLDTTTDPTTPRLIRRVNNRAGSTVAMVLDDLQLSYDLVDGVTNPTNIKTPIAPNSPNQIRKISIFLAGRSASRVRNTRDFLRHNLTTQVSFRSLSFIDRYR